LLALDWDSEAYAVPINTQPARLSPFCVNRSRQMRLKVSGDENGGAALPRRPLYFCGRVHEIRR
jgi:hypothetical protein